MSFSELADFFADFEDISKVLRDARLFKWFQLAPMTLEQVRTLFPPKLEWLADRVYRVAQEKLWGSDPRLILVDETFPEAKCFHRIVICKQPFPPYVEHLIAAERQLIYFIESRGVHDTMGQIGERLENVLLDLSFDLDGSRDKLIKFLHDEMFADDQRYMFYRDQCNILEEEALYQGADYMCVALDKRAFPLYWLSVVQRQGMLYYKGFAKSLVNTLVTHYDTTVNYTYPGCGAPFFSYTTDKLMHQSAVPYFFVTALKGTKKTLATIEGTPGDKPQKLYKLANAPMEEEVKNLARTEFHAVHVYFPTEDFMNAWKSANESSTKRSRTALEGRLVCVACNMNVAKWRRQDLPDHVFCSEHCCYGE
jgi:hypothetical protein